MYEIWIEEDGREHHRQSLAEGTFQLGRLAENEIHVPDNNISRHHLRLEISAAEVMVTDLGSTNGTQLNGRQLTPNQSTYWPLQDSLRIGPLRVHMRRIDSATAEPTPLSTSPVPALHPPLATGPLIATIVCREAVPQIYNLAAGAIFIGSAPTCPVRLVTAGVAPNHCQITFINNQAQVVNLDASRPALLAGKPLPASQPQPWQPGQPLQIGGATLFVTLAPAGSTPYQAANANRRPIRQGRWWRYLVGLMILAAVGFVCVSASAIVGARQAGCDGLDPRCILSALDFSRPAGSQTPQQQTGPGTPTLAPVQTVSATPTRPNVINFGEDTPVPTAELSCETTMTAAEFNGWLELPFPYDGTEEQFRRISQRSRFGGRINSFFDHEYPVYPPSVNGLEPLNPITVTNSLVIFDGSRSIDAYQDADEGDWYSGHAGIDFAPENAFREDTPVLAAADGFLYLAEIDNDGNHMVWLVHNPDGDNRNNYITLYFHLKPDPFFEQRVAQYAAMQESDDRIAITAGERIGTMGTTGRSSGIHLHFEVRYDTDNNRNYTRFERVDPYGFFGSQEIPVDPWSQDITWIADDETEQHQEGVVSDYLWKHPLVDVEEGEPVCVQEVNVQVDLYPLLGWAVVDPGFTLIIRNEAGDVIDAGSRRQRDLTILPEDLAFVDIDSVSLEFLPPGGDPQRDWQAVPPERTELIPEANGRYTFRAQVNQTGRYVLVGRQTKDLVPPVVQILLNGERTGEPNSFRDSVIVTLIGSDLGFPSRSGVREIQYSLDCGANWIVYDGTPFTVTEDTAHSCGGSGVGEQGVQFAANQFQLLAIATDFNENVQQPASQAIFTIE